MARFVALCVLLALGHGTAVSPVQKVIELLDETKAKIVKDLAAEEKAMAEYSSFCDEEQETKGYAIKDAASLIMKLTADAEEGQAKVNELDDEIAALGTDMAEKDKEVAEITATRKAEDETFKASETELLGSIDELARAIVQLKKATSFLQVKGTHQGRAHRGDALKLVTRALGAIVDANWVQSGDRRRLKSFIQQGQAEGDDLRAAPEAAAYESQSGGILETIEEMKEKAEDSLSDLRKEESKKVHSFEMMSQSLEKELSLAMEKKAEATSNKGAKSEQIGEAKAELAEVTKTKAADEAYVSSLSVECQETADQWAARQAEAKEEMGAVEKAKEILAGGVKVFVQVGADTKVVARQAHQGIFEDEDNTVTVRRSGLVGKLKMIARRYHSFALMEMASAAASDPFEKIRGLIEDMITKLMNEANEEATQKGFCDEEIGKSKESQKEKSMELEKLTTRGDKAAATKTTLEGEIKELEAEIGDIDKAQAEATAIRTQENEEYKVSSKDFKDSAEATEKAIIVLRQYYEGALIQVGQKDKVVQHAKAAAAKPEFGSAKGDAGSSIISILEMAAEDFTKTYTDIEAAEVEAVKSYEKLSQENEVSKTAKEAEKKAKESEVKSLSVTMQNSKTDADMVSKELDSVNEYLEKLKPQCESKVMSYEEKKAKREAEIEGLKEALGILDGTAV